MADLVAAYGLELDQWQEDVLRAGLGERSDGRWAARQIGVSAPRQQGKTMLIVARVLAGLLLFDERVIIVSAHRQDTAREVFFRLVQFIEDNDDLNDRVDFIARSEMREFIRLKTGQEVRFKSRATGSGRGFSCDCLLLDEAQILADSAWSAILPTMSARPNPQVWLFGTPPTPDDDGEVFGRLRQAGIERSSSRIAYLEWSAEVGDDLDAFETWAKANPAIGSRISTEAIEAERTSMSDEQFAMERLGMWAHESHAHVIDEQTWQAVADPSSMPIERLTLAIDVNPDRSSAAISLAGKRPDGLWHVEMDNHRRGADWTIGWVKQRAEKNRLHAVVVDELAGLTEKRRNGRHYLKGTDIAVTLAAAEGRDMAMAWATFHDAVTSATVRHTDQPQVNVALSQAGTRDLQGGKALSKKTSTSDITPLTSQTLALWGAQRDDIKRPTRSTGRSSGRREAVVL